LLHPRASPFRSFVVKRRRIQQLSRSESLAAVREGTFGLSDFLLPAAPRLLKLPRNQDGGNDDCHSLFIDGILAAVK
jgi:hypothetical protein